jgi:hypothetical protein
MSCQCDRRDSTIDSQLLHKLVCMEHELVETAKRVVKNASDPFTAVIRFLAERPENNSLPGYVVNRVLLQTFGTRENVPSLVTVLAQHCKEIIRQSNVISIINEHPAAERWGAYLIKQKERIKFEVGREKDKLVLKNIIGLVAVEHGIELALDKILVNPPKLEVTLKLGLLRPHRTVDIA